MAEEGTIDVTVFMLRPGIGPLAIAVNPVVFACTFAPGSLCIVTIVALICSLFFYYRIVADKDYAFDMLDLYHSALVALVRTEAEKISLRTDIVKHARVLHEHGIALPAYLTIVSPRVL